MRYIIAEIGSVHDGSFGNAKKLIELASNCGANIVKFQTHIAEAETTKKAPKPKYFKDEKRYDYFKRTSFSFDQWKKLVEFSKQKKIEFMSSPFSIEAFHLLLKLNVKKIKIPSGEVNNLPLIEEISKNKKLQIFISSGMSSWKELDESIKILKNNNLVIMQCSSMYPCPPEKVGLNVINEMKKKYKRDIGYSDHTIGMAAPFAAATLGAVAIEKHLTFSKYMYGSDAKNGMEPKDFFQMSNGIKEIWKMIDHNVDKNDIKNFKNMKKIFEKSIVIKKNIKKNQKIFLEDICFKKPGNGIPSKMYKKVIGKKANKNLKVDKLLDWKDIN